MSDPFMDLGAPVIGMIMDIRITGMIRMTKLMRIVIMIGIIFVIDMMMG